MVLYRRFLLLPMEESETQSFYHRERQKTSSTRTSSSTGGLHAAFYALATDKLCLARPRPAAFEKRRKGKSTKTTERGKRREKKKAGVVSRIRERVLVFARRHPLHDGGREKKKIAPVTRSEREIALASCVKEERHQSSSGEERAKATSSAAHGEEKQSEGKRGAVLLGKKVASRP